MPRQPNAQTVETSSFSQRNLIRGSDKAYAVAPAAIMGAVRSMNLPRDVQLHVSNILQARQQGRSPTAPGQRKAAPHRRNSVPQDARRPAPNMRNPIKRFDQAYTRATNLPPMSVSPSGHEDQTKRQKGSTMQTWERHRSVPPVLDTRPRTASQSRRTKQVNPNHRWCSLDRNPSKFTTLSDGCVWCRPSLYRSTTRAHRPRPRPTGAARTSRAIQSASRHFSTNESVVPHRRCQRRSTRSFPGLSSPSRPLARRRHNSFPSCPSRLLSSSASTFRRLASVRRLSRSLRRKSRSPWGL